MSLITKLDTFKGNIVEVTDFAPLRHPTHRSHRRLRWRRRRCRHRRRREDRHHRRVRQEVRSRDKTPKILPAKPFWREIFCYDSFGLIQKLTLIPPDVPVTL